MEGALVKLNPGLPWQKLHLTRRRSFNQQIGLKFEEESSEALFCMVLKLGRSGQQIRYISRSESCVWDLNLTCHKLCCIYN